MILIDRETVLRDYDDGVSDLEALCALLPTVHGASAPLVLKLADGSVAVAAAPSMLYGAKPRQGKVSLGGGATLIAEGGELHIEGLPIAGDIPDGIYKGGTVRVTQCHIRELEVTRRLVAVLASGAWGIEDVHAGAISTLTLKTGSLGCSTLEVPASGSISAGRTTAVREKIDVPSVDMDVIETGSPTGARQYPYPHLTITGRERKARFYMQGSYGAAPKARLRIQVPISATASVMGPSTDVMLTTEPQLVDVPEMLDALLIYPYYTATVTENSSAVYEMTYSVRLGGDPNVYERVLVSNPTGHDIEGVPHAWAFSRGRDYSAVVTVLATLSVPAMSTCEFLFSCNAAAGTACMYPTGEAVHYA